MSVGEGARAGFSFNMNSISHPPLLLPRPALIWITEQYGDRDFINQRGSALVSIPLSACLGLLVSSVAVWTLSDWRVSTALGLCPIPFLLLAISLGHLPESRVWLRKQGLPEEGSTAHKESSGLLGNEAQSSMPPGAESSLASAQTTLSASKTLEWEEATDDEGDSNRSWLSDSSIRFRVALCVALFACDILGGSNAVISYGPLLMKVGCCGRGGRDGGTGPQNLSGPLRSLLHSSYRTWASATAFLRSASSTLPTSSGPSSPCGPWTASGGGVSSSAGRWRWRWCSSRCRWSS